MSGTPEGRVEAKAALPPAAPPAMPASGRERDKKPLPGWARLALGIFLLLAVFAAWEVLTAYVAYTSDAYVRSNLVAVAPQVSGQIVRVAVADNEPVRRGDLLAELDPVPFRLNVNAAAAAVQAATADSQAAADSVAAAKDQQQGTAAALTDAEEQQKRSVALSNAGYASGETLDATTEALLNAKANDDAAKAAVARARTLAAADQAKLAGAEAQLAVADWQLGQTRIFAPADGTINHLTLEPGDMATSGVPMIGIVAAHAWRVIANYKQGYLDRLHVGQTAWVWLESRPWHVYRARIAGIGRGIARQQQDDGLLPYVAPTTNWIRLAHRFPVTLTLVDPPKGLVLYMGADARCVIFP